MLNSCERKPEKLSKDDKDGIVVLTHIARAAITISIIKGFLRTFTQRRGMQFHALHMILAVWELGSV